MRGSQPQLTMAFIPPPLGTCHGLAARTEEPSFGQDDTTVIAMHIPSRAYINTANTTPPGVIYQIAYLSTLGSTRGRQTHGPPAVRLHGGREACRGSDFWALAHPLSLSLSHTHTHTRRPVDVRGEGTYSTYCTYIGYVRLSRHCKHISSKRAVDWRASYAGPRTRSTALRVNGRMRHGYYTQLAVA